MLRYVILIAAACVVCRWVFGRWPWDYLRPLSASAQARVRARTLLGVGAEARREDIIAAHRRLTAMVHPDRGGTTAAMQEANAARDLLLADLPSAQTGSPDHSDPPQSQD